MSSAILRSSFAASVRTTFSKSQRTTTTTKRSVMTKAVRKHRREKRHLFSHVHTITFTMKKGFFFSRYEKLWSVGLSFFFATNFMLSLFPNTQCLSFTNTHTHTQVTITEGVGTLFFVFSFFLFFPGKFYDSGSCCYCCCCCCCCCCLLRVIASLSS